MSLFFQIHGRKEPFTNKIQGALAYRIRKVEATRDVAHLRRGIEFIDLYRQTNGELFAAVDLLASLTKKYDAKFKAQEARLVADGLEHERLADACADYLDAIDHRAVGGDLPSIFLELAEEKRSDGAR